MFHDSALYLRLTGEWFPMELHLGLSGHYVQYLLLVVIPGALGIPALHIPSTAQCNSVHSETSGGIPRPTLGLDSGLLPLVRCHGNQVGCRVDVDNSKECDGL